MLGSHELPDFITLNSLRPHFAYLRIVIVGSCNPDLRDQLQNGVKGYIAEPRCRAKGIAFHEGCNDSGAFRRTQRFMQLLCMIRSSMSGGK
jgi:hypothetical protein